MNWYMESCLQKILWNYVNSYTLFFFIIYFKSFNNFFFWTFQGCLVLSTKGSWLPVAGTTRSRRLLRTIGGVNCVNPPSTLPSLISEFLSAVWWRMAFEKCPVEKWSSYMVRITLEEDPNRSEHVCRHPLFSLLGYTFSSLSFLFCRVF